jgi:Domain of unknown function (DUF4271)
LQRSRVAHLQTSFFLLDNESTYFIVSIHCSGFLILLHTQLQLVKKIVLFLFYCILLSQFSFAQTQGDTAVPKQPDTAIVVPQAAPVKKDTSLRKTVVPKKITDTNVRAITPAVTPAPDTIALDTTASLVMLIPEAQSTGNTLLAFQAAMRNHPYYNFTGKPRVLLMKEREGVDKDGLFYFLAGLLFYFAIIKILFSKYLDNIMTLFFRVTMRQQQLREQLSQTPMPSLLLNILFIISGGMFLAFVSLYYKITPEQNLWLLWGYGCAIVIAVYLGKFIILKIIGWIFNVSNATDTYIFIIFMVNKMVGIFLVPALILMAFPYEPFLPVVMTLTFIMLGLSLGYRFLISYKPIRHEIKVSRFHFFVYLCAFEIAPLLLIYKVLLIFVERSY